MWNYFGCVHSAVFVSTISFFLTFVISLQLILHFYFLFYLIFFYKALIMITVIDF